MMNIKWFAAGEDRRKYAEQIITSLLADNQVNARNKALEQVLTIYLEELNQQKNSVSLVLSRMNVELANAIKKDGVPLTEEQFKNLKKLVELSYIRYGS